VIKQTKAKKMIGMKYSKIYLPIYLFVVMMNISYAQKLPNKQEVSLRTPADLKIDGNSTEWGNQYQAYNKSIECFYTIANDDDKLYLILHATKSNIIEKMVKEELALQFSLSGKKDDDKNVTILFPVMPIATCRQVLLSAGKKLNAGNYLIPGYDPKDTAYISKLKSSISSANTKLTENMKEIKISGITPIVDTVAGVTEKTPYYRLLPLHIHYFKIISVANDDHIRATSRFDETGAYTYEMSIPIKYIGLSTDNFQKIIYNIVIHGRGEDARPGNTWWYGPVVNGTKEILYQDLENPTDFWGEYILAKK